MHVTDDLCISVDRYNVPLLNHVYKYFLGTWYSLNYVDYRVINTRTCWPVPDFHGLNRQSRRFSRLPYSLEYSYSTTIALLHPVKYPMYELGHYSTCVTGCSRRSIKVEEYYKVVFTSRPVERIFGYLCKGVYSHKHIDRALMRWGLDWLLMASPLASVATRLIRDVATNSPSLIL